MACKETIFDLDTFKTCMNNSWTVADLFFFNKLNRDHSYSMEVQATIDRLAYIDDIFSVLIFIYHIQAIIVWLFVAWLQYSNAYRTCGCYMF